MAGTIPTLNPSKDLTPTPRSLSQVSEVYITMLNGQINLV